MISLKKEELKPNLRCFPKYLKYSKLSRGFSLTATEASARDSLNNKSRDVIFKIILNLVSGIVVQSEFHSR